MKKIDFFETHKLRDLTACLSHIPQPSHCVLFRDFGMNIEYWSTSCVLLCCSLAAATDYDVVVYGSTPAGAAPHS